MNGIPKFIDLKDVFFDEEVAVQYLIDRGVLTPVDHCQACGCETSRKNLGKQYKCKQRDCRKINSIFKDTFFFRAKIPISSILHMAYLWLCKDHELSIQTKLGVSNDTVTVWTAYFRQLVTWDIENLDVEDFKIGGPGVIVEIDESKFGKRKYNQGHQVEGVWVVGGVERTNERRVFAIPVADRSAQTLKEVIEDHVVPGSIIYTDCWGGYRPEDLLEIGMVHDTVNHSLHYVDPITGVHTNTIEGTWSAMKWDTNKRHRTQEYIGDNLFYFIWRRRYKNQLWDY
jgi:hypothetical protein